MLDLKITKQRFVDHLYYSKWMYVGIIAAAMVLFSLIFTVTKPVVPNALKVDITVLGMSMQDMEKSQWQKDILATLSEDQQEVNIYTLGFSSEDGSMDYSMYEVMAARMAAKEDDILILPKEIYLSFASQGGFLPMDDVAALYDLPEDYNLDELTLSTEDNPESHLYGIPISHLMGFVDLGIDPTDKVMAVLVYTENYDNALKAIDYIMGKTDSVLLSQAPDETEE